MKNIIYTLAIIFSFIANAQEIIIPIENYPNTDTSTNNSTYYFKDVNNKLNKFVGTWKYETATELYEVTFYKVIHDHVSGDYFDTLNSNSRYTKNGVVIFDTYPTNSTSNNLIFGEVFESELQLSLFYSEPNTKRTMSARVLIEYHASATLGAPKTLSWQIKTLETKTVAGAEVYPYEVPQNMVLNKQ